MPLDYPLIRRNEIIFNESYTSAEVYEVGRTLRPLVIDNVTEDEYDWLSKNAKGEIVVDCYHQGISYQDYDLIRNPQNSQVALKWQGMLMLNPLETLAVRFYDGLTNEVERMRLALEKHRKGQASGWGDQQIPDMYMFQVSRQTSD
jgi:hypothetical protein